MQKAIRVGTRDSLLALAQTRLVCEQLERETGRQFELVAMKTSGDQQTDKPLWQMDGKNFFTKELDDALLSGKVDMTVSSYKDLSTERGDGIALAAITNREYSQDILLIKKETVAKLQAMEHLVVGTSSPRRIQNISTRLSHYLPFGENIQVECRSLRGNVVTRMKKLQEDQYDAIVLALAGLERLAQHSESKEQLKQLLDGFTFMILPEREFPSAPAQGALALECRADDQELKELLSVANHQQTVEEIEKERKHFSGFGGGCHLPVGIYVRKSNNGFLHVIKGQQDGKILEREFWEGERPAPEGEFAFLGLPDSGGEPGFLFDQITQKRMLDVRGKKVDHLFITSGNCLNVLDEYSADPLWVSGSKTWRKVIKLGHWVNGSADSMGELELKKLLDSLALQMMITGKDLKVATSDSVKSSLGETVPCYQKYYLDLTEEFIDKLLSIKTFYWTSFSQFEFFTNNFPSLKDESHLHCCGLGKTYNAFLKEGIKAYPFISVDDFQNWFNRRD